MNMINVENAYWRYPSARNDTIKGVSFDVREGEIFGFLGPSGAGKSTLQKMLTGVLREYRGSVCVFGNEMRHRTRDYYEQIGVDFEFPNFYGKFTAMENLHYFASLYTTKHTSHRMTMRKTKQPNPMDMLERVGLQKDAHKKISAYSKGMKMRLAFVRCLLHNPPLLFLDEPTSGLDPANARIIKDMIVEQKKMGKTILLTTHNMHDAEELCDRVAFIADGVIKALDTPQSLRKSAADTQVEYRFKENGTEIMDSCLLSALGRSAAFQAALKAGTLTAIHSKEQTLEDVFIALTGKHLL